jgi:hypothetical protein
VCHDLRWQHNILKFSDGHVDGDEMIFGQIENLIASEDRKINELPDQGDSGHFGKSIAGGE